MSDDSVLNQDQITDTRGPRILMVEDQLNLGQMLLSTLQQAGFQVAAVTGGAAAIRVLENEQIDLVLLDILMPGMNGLDVINELNARHISQPIIMLSNVDDPAAVEEAKKLGALAYFVKATTTPQEIVETIKKLFAHHDPI